MKSKLMLLASAAVFAASVTGTAASAAPLLFSYTPTTDIASAFTFSIDSDPAPLYTNPSTYFQAAITNATGQYAGFSTRSFYNDLAGGGLGGYYGAQLYSGDEFAPTFKTGTYTLLNAGDPSLAGSLTISNVAVAAVPETATWAMMLAGFGMIGFAARRRSSVKTTVRFA